MRRYMIQISFSTKSVQGLVAKPQNRKTQANAVVKQLGGKLVDYYFTFGDWDGVVIADLKNDVDAMSVALMIGASGAGSTKITGLHSMADAMKAMRKANSIAYKPPAG